MFLTSEVITLGCHFVLFFVLHCSGDFCFPPDERNDTLVYRSIGLCAARTLRSNLSPSVTRHHGNVSKLGLTLCYTFQTFDAGQEHVKYEKKQN